jgi:hypothetical protein
MRKLEKNKNKMMTYLGFGQDLDIYILPELLGLRRTKPCPSLFELFRSKLLFVFLEETYNCLENRKGVLDSNLRFEGRGCCRRCRIWLRERREKGRKSDNAEAIYRANSDRYYINQAVGAHIWPRAISLSEFDKFLQRFCTLHSVLSAEMHGPVQLPRCPSEQRLTAS